MTTTFEDLNDAEITTGSDFQRNYTITDEANAARPVTSATFAISDNPNGTNQIVAGACVDVDFANGVVGFHVTAAQTGAYTPIINDLLVSGEFRNFKNMWFDIRVVFASGTTETVIRGTLKWYPTAHA